MDTVWREIRYTFRRLAKSPTTSFAAVITMALGIGVATGAYSIIDGLMLRGVCFEEAERLVALRRTNQRHWDVLCEQYNNRNHSACKAENPEDLDHHGAPDVVLEQPRMLDKHLCPILEEQPVCSHDPD